MKKKTVSNTSRILLIVFGFLFTVALVRIFLFHSPKTPESFTSAQLPQSCTVSLTIPQSSCNEPCMERSDCSTGFCLLPPIPTPCPPNANCLQVLPQTGVCRTESDPGNVLCPPQHTPTMTPSCSVQVECAAPPEGCYYEGSSQCSCGQLVCDTTPIPTCSQRPVCITTPCEFPEPPGGWCDEQRPTSTPTPACTPRPACLDTEPPCEIAEPAAGWCPSITNTPTSFPCVTRPTCLDKEPFCYPAEPAGGWCPLDTGIITSTPRPIEIPTPPFWWDWLPQNLRGFLEQLYLTLFYFNKDSTNSHLLDGIFQ